MKSLIGLLVGSALLAHGQQRASRIHTATEAKTLRMIPADQIPPATSDITIDEKSSDRRIEANGIPNHEVGLFPNRGNPHEIKEQCYRFELTNPKPNRPPNRCIKNRNAVSRSPTCRSASPSTAFSIPVPRSFGKAIEPVVGTTAPSVVPLDSGSTKPPMFNLPELYHHGLPTGLPTIYTQQDQDRPSSPADGHPIYALYGYAKKGSNNIIEHTLVIASKEIANHPTPKRSYDGTFVQDYVYQKGSAHSTNGGALFIPRISTRYLCLLSHRKLAYDSRAFRADPQSLREPDGAKVPLVDKKRRPKTDLRSTSFFCSAFGYDSNSSLKATVR